MYIDGVLGGAEILNAANEPQRQVIGIFEKGGIFPQFNIGRFILVKKKP